MVLLSPFSSVEIPEVTLHQFVLSRMRQFLTRIGMQKKHAAINMVLLSPFSSVEIPEVTLHQFVLSRMRQFLTRIGMVEGVTGKQWTYAELLDAVEKTSSGLARLGFSQGDVMVLCLPNMPEYLIMMLASWTAGGVVTVMNPTYTSYEIANQVRDTQARWCFTSNEQVGKVKEALTRADSVKKIITLSPEEGCISIKTLLEDDGSCCVRLKPTNVRDQVAAILYSSGTTGLPKGVMLTHYNIVANLHQRAHPECVNPNMDPTKQSCVVAYLPYFHIMGLVVLGFQCLASGTKIVTLPYFEPHLFFSTIQKYKVTLLTLVPPTVTLMLKSPLVHQYDLSSIELVGCGAAPLGTEVADMFAEKLGLPEIRNGYGMTEVSLAATAFGWVKPPKRGSIGFLLPNMQGKIVDTETMAELGTNQRGELLLRGPNIMKGYLNNREETMKTLDKDGWLRTGDVAFVDEEGYISIVDRLKELIKYNGFQVAPAELEAVMLTHDDVAEVGVVGVADDVAGQLPAAAVVLKKGRTVTESDLLAYASDRLAPYKRLRGGIHFVNNIPKTETGKSLRRKLLNDITLAFKTSKL